MCATELIEKYSTIKKENFQNNKLSFTKHYSEVTRQLRQDFEQVVDTFKYKNGKTNRYWSKEDFVQVKAVFECVVDSSCMFLDRTETGYCNKAVDTIANELMMSRDTVMRNLKLLVRMGYLIKVEVKGRTNYYFAIDVPPNNEEALLEIEQTKREAKPARKVGSSTKTQITEEVPVECEDDLADAIEMIDQSKNESVCKQVVQPTVLIQESDSTDNIDDNIIEETSTLDLSELNKMTPDELDEWLLSDVVANDDALPF